jgi:hypothetical protein
VIDPKPAGEACAHCTGKGCGVYAQRPQICKSYECGYRLGLTRDKPEEVRVSWVPQPDDAPGGIMLMTGHCLDWREVIKDSRNVSQIREWLQESEVITGVVLRDHNGVVRFLKDERAVIADIDQTDPLKVNVVLSSQRYADFRLF